MHHYLKRIPLYNICIFLLLGLTILPLRAPAEKIEDGTNRDVSAFAEPYILESINLIRKENHLRALTISPALQALARDHSRYMAENGYLGHEQGGMGFSTRIENARLNGWREVGENVGCSQGYRNNADTIISGWMKSRHHRKNILSAAFTMTGIGTAKADDGTLYATQVFMNPDDHNRVPTR